MESDQHIFNSWEKLDEIDSYIQDYSFDLIERDEINAELIEIDDDNHETESIITKISLNKKKKRKRADKLIDEFNNDDLLDQILAWDTLKLSENPNLGVLSNLPSIFKSNAHYFKAIREICIIEARMGIFKGMKCTEGELNLKFLAIRKTKRPLDKRMLIEFKFEGDISLTQPGWIFSLQRRENDDLSVFAAVAQGRDALKIADRGILPLWINYSKFGKLFDLGKDNLVENMNMFFRSFTEWKGKGLVNIISYQRMDSACLSCPNPPFMNELLGVKSPVHIKFDEPSGLEPSSTISENLNSELISLENSHNQSIFKDINVNKKKFSSNVQKYLSGLNVGQSLALKSIVKSVEKNSPTNISYGSLSLVQGPPGCGKTHFLVNLIFVMLVKGYKLMICAPSNKAICLLVENFLVLNNNRNNKFMSALIGVEEKLKEVSNENDSIVNTPKTAQDTLDNKNQQHLSMFRELHLIVSSLIEPKLPMHVYVYKVVDTLQNCFKLLSKELDRATKKIKIDKESSNLYEYGIVITEAKKITTNLLSYVSDSSVTVYNEFSIVLIKLESLLNDIITLYINEYGENFTNIINPSEQIKNFSPSAKFSDEVGLFSTRIFEILPEISNLFRDEGILTTFISDIVSNSSIVFSTLSSTGHSIIKNNKSLHFDILLVDEAAQV